MKNYEKLAKKFGGKPLEESTSPAPPKPPADSYQPPRLRYPAGPEPGFFFPGRQAKYHENQVKDIHAKTDIIMARATAATRMEIIARTHDNELQQHPIRLQETNARLSAAFALEMENHHTAIVQADATAKLTKRALKEGLDLPSHMTLVVEEAKVKTEVRRTFRLAAIDVMKARALEKTRLQGYEREARIDMEAVLGMHMLPVEKLDYMNAKILRLKKQGAEPERITAMEALRDQMERRLLENPAEEDVEGSDNPQESL